MKTSLTVPKLMQWAHSLDQQYLCSQTILLTSGCSFTASTDQLETAASWPGFVMDRCRFDYCIDYSWSGSGNRYIGDSILHHFDSTKEHDWSKYFVIVMWSGIDRYEEKIFNSQAQPNLGGVCYQRTVDQNSKTPERDQAINSFEKIIEVFNFLKDKNIKFAFSSYVNLLFPPYIPKRDTTKEFDKWLDKSQLKMLKEIPWVPNQPLDFLYEYAWKNDYLNSGDFFHPPVECNLTWTDNILLPELCKQGLIAKI